MISWLFFSALAGASTFTPPQASTVAKYYDELYGFLLIASFISCVLVIGGLIYFSYKYRRRGANDKTAYITHNNTLEFLWSFIPFVVFMIVFVWGWVVFNKMRSGPADSFEVHAFAQKWSWDFEYKSGKKSPGEFYVPVNTPIRMIMTSRDVIHSFYIPAFRIKQDVVPGRYTSIWFEPTKLGTFQIFCAEYCGDGHSAMLAKIHVVPKKEFDDWLGNDPFKGLSLLDIGQKVYTTRCAVCHNTTTERKVGPGFQGIFGHEAEFEGGIPSLVVDENYIRESILNPAAKIVKGYPNGMPSFQGQLSEQELAGVIELIKSLK